MRNQTREPSRLHKPQKGESHQGQHSPSALPSPSPWRVQHCHVDHLRSPPICPPPTEIWFTEQGGHFYLVAERESANWVRNIQSQPQVKVRVGDTEFNAIARVVHSDREPQLAAIVKALFDTKYGWSDGLIAELTPE
jgi:F420H(2)-dependent quinone reductase